MYCTYCGHLNPDENVVCEQCNKPMVKPRSFPRVDDTQPKKTLQAQPTPNQPYTPAAIPSPAVKNSFPAAVAPGQTVYMQSAASKNPSAATKRASISAGVVLICFFLPWIMVSCSVTGGGVEANAWEITTGNYAFLRNFQQGANSLFGSGYSNN